MKFLFTADIHLSRYSQDKIDKETGLPEKIVSLRTVLYQMAQYCVENKIDKFIIGGDIYHTKSVIYSIAQEVLFDFLNSYKNIQFIILDGNHDLSDRGDFPISSLRPLRECSNVLWIENNKPLKIENILLVPYSSRLKDIIMKEEGTDILISHFGLNEAKLNSGISIISELKISDLRKFKLVLLGHYHKPQKITSEETTVYYVGSPIQLDWGEKGDEKRFLIVDSETLEVKSIPTVGYKKHIELEINNENKEKVLKEAEKYMEDGNFVKLVKTSNVDLDKKNLDKFNIVDKTEKDTTDRGITSTMSQQERLKRYIEIKQIPQEKIDQYLKMGLNLIERAEKEE